MKMERAKDKLALYEDYQENFTYLIGSTISMFFILNALAIPMLMIIIADYFQMKV